MPEYLQIQTYIRYDEKNFKECVLKFQRFLKEIGFSENYIQENFKDIEWVGEDNGFIYSGCNLESQKFEYIKIRPLILGWTTRENSEISESWLQFELLFESDEIVCDYRTRKLKDGIKEIIIKYMISLSNYFSETGTYFTDEVTDDIPWKALVGLKEKIWAFDIAIIPMHLQSLYSQIPSEFTAQIIQDKHLYIRKRI